MVERIHPAWMLREQEVVGRIRFAAGLHSAIPDRSSQRRPIVPYPALVQRP